MSNDAAAAAEELRRHRQQCVDCATARHYRHGSGCDRGRELERQAATARAELDADRRRVPLPGQLGLF